MRTVIAEVSMRLIAATPVVYSVVADHIEPDGPTLRGAELDMIRQHRSDVVLRGNQGLGEHNALIVVYDLEPTHRRSYFLTTIEGYRF
jgi:hypothetical protein